MNELLGRPSAEFDESENWIQIVGADWGADGMRLSLSILLYENTEPELWEISCSGVIEESLPLACGFACRPVAAGVAVQT